MKRAGTNKLICSNKIKVSVFAFILVMVSVFVVSLGSIYKQKLAMIDQPLNQSVFLDAVINENVNLIFYKDKCPYCKAAEETVINESKKNGLPTFFINLDSPDGQALKVKYNVKYASTMVTIRRGKASNTLYAKKTNGDYSADRSNIKKALSKSNK